MAFTWEKQWGLYQSKVTFSLTCIHSHVNKHTTVKWSISRIKGAVRNAYHFCILSRIWNKLYNLTISLPAALSREPAYWHLFQSYPVKIEKKTEKKINRKQQQNMSSSLTFWIVLVWRLMAYWEQHPVQHALQLIVLTSTWF